MPENPEIGKSIAAGGIQTNYHDAGSGSPVLLLHGSGPGVSAWANWRLNMPHLAERLRVIAPDVVGFGFTQRPPGVAYNLDMWVKHMVDLLDALQVPRTHIVGNSFGGALAVALAVRQPERVARMVLMGSAGVTFSVTEALDFIWGYTPSLVHMRKILDYMAYNRALVTDELAELRYRASLRPGVQEAYAAMFPPPRQRWIDALASPEEEIRRVPHETLIIHGRDDRVLPYTVAIKLHNLIAKSQLHVFGQCGHWTQIEHAPRFNRLVREFLTE